MSARAVWLSVLLLAAIGCKSALVGATCKPGYTLCGNRCLDLRTDPRHCGSCDNDCGELACVQGSCRAPSIDAGAADASTTDASLPGDAAAADGGAADGGGDFQSDAGLTGCYVGQQSCDGTCADLRVDHDHCGSCDTACGATQVCSSGNCQDLCDAPLTLCGGACFDLSIDPTHCGSCGQRCTSGICEQSRCGGAIAGQAVVIGHDLVESNNAMQRLVGNAVFLASGAPVRVLVYRGDADAASVAGVEAAIDAAKLQLGRDWQRIDAIESLVPLQLSAADVLLVHAQAGATRMTIDRLGQEWGNAMAQFVAQGGVIVVMEAPSVLNDGTFHVLEASNIFSAASRESVAAQQLTVRTPGLGVAVRVPDRYMSADHTVHFKGVSMRGAFVVVDRDQLPVVVQRVIIAR